MATDRKSVLLRFPTELLDRVDEAASVRPRSQFLLELIEQGVSELEDIGELHQTTLVTQVDYSGDPVDCTYGAGTVLAGIETA